ncbi:MAG: hypothetical protein H3C62_15840, partial [Gemmatimonadaceae bacterium]|nr:hypothetical protein [Gemmatimonadaceae bacterium]
MAEVVKLRETDVAAVALAALASQWVEYWPEVPSLSGRVDIVGRDAAGGIHAVECKTSASLALAGQAMDRIAERAFSSVLVVAGQSDAARAWRDKTGVSDLVKIGLVAGFGVAFVRNGVFRLECPPRELAVEDGARKAVARALCDLHREVAGDAGGQSSAYWTLWKQGLRDLEAAVRAQPGINVAELRWKLELTKTLYWRNHNAQVRALAEQSKCVRAEFHGRE